MARDPIVTRFTRVGGGVTTFARACPVSLSPNPLSPGIEVTPKTDLSLSRSLVHRQTWRLTGSLLLIAVHLCLNTFSHVQRHFTACHRSRILGNGRGILGWISLSHVVWSQAEKAFACNLILSFKCNLSAIVQQRNIFMFLFITLFVSWMMNVYSVQPQLYLGICICHCYVGRCNA